MIRNIIRTLLVTSLSIFIFSCGGSGDQTPESKSPAVSETPDAAPAKEAVTKPAPEEAVAPEPEAKAAEAKPTPDEQKPAVEKKKPEAAPAKGPHPGLLDPSKATAAAPASFRAKFETTKGSFIIEVHREWSPKGADRFYNLIKVGYFQEIAFFRAIEGFMVQFGISGDPKINGVWKDATITDDPVKTSNDRGYISFATAGPNTRSNQLFINLVNNASLDSMGFSPIGKIIDGMSVLDSLYKGYGEGAPSGQGPSQAILSQQGNPYLKSQFPKLDYIKKASILD